jgi:alpha-mannosidase
MRIRLWVIFWLAAASVSLLPAQSKRAATTMAQASLSQAAGPTSGAPDLTKQPTLYVVGYAHLDTEWRWEYPQVIDEYLLHTMRDNFPLFEKYPHYIFNFTGANRYRLMKEYFPADFAKVREYVKQGRWFPAGSSMEEGDVNAPSAEGILRQVLYGNEWFRKEFGKASAEYMLPDCFGFPASLPSILAHAGVKGFSTQKLTWGSSADVGGTESRERTPEGIPFNVGVWAGPDGQSVIAAFNPGSYTSWITSDLTQPLPAESQSPAVEEMKQELQARLSKGEVSNDRAALLRLQALQQFFEDFRRSQEFERYQQDWASRVENNGKSTGVYTDYRYYGTGDIGGAPRDESVKLLEATITKGKGVLPPPGTTSRTPKDEIPAGPEVQLGNGPVRIVSANADQMFLDITPSEEARLPQFSGELELTNHSAGSLTSQAYIKRWIRQEELVADAAEKASVAAQWLGGREYPLERLNDAWTLAMAAHFHDIAAGTATPKSYEFAWNDAAVALNQFAGVLSDASEAISSGLDTRTSGEPVVVYNPLNIPREDLVEAKVDFPRGLPRAVRVVGPDGKPAPAQLQDGKVLFLAKAPSVGYAVYDVQSATGPSENSSLKVTLAPAGQERAAVLENARYRVTIDRRGDVSSLYDKSLGRELLAGPARMELTYDNPTLYPAWNMDWDQAEAKPRAYVGGPAKIRVVENGPVRVAVEVTRETEGSKFTQIVRLAAGDAGNRVEFHNAIDWRTKEANLKASFPFTAANAVATYNLGIGTIERPNAKPKKFEVPTHQWVDLTDASGKFGVTLLTDCKNGSDKPTDGTIRLTLLRSPGTDGGYHDQSTQDFGHHEFTYGVAGHAGAWRQDNDENGTVWQAYRLNDPLIAFQASKHSGALGKEFSFLKINNPRIRVMALKKAEQSDEVILRMVETEGRPESDVRVTFTAPITSAREVNGQEQPVGGATVHSGALATSFTAYQPRTFAIKLAASSSKIAPIESRPVELSYDLAASSNDGTKSAGGFDAQGRALPAEMLPADIDFNGVRFHLATSHTGTPDAVVAKGQAIQLPAGEYDSVYLLAASADGDQNAAFRVGGKSVNLNVQDWGGFVGQWDNRVWRSEEEPGTVPSGSSRTRTDRTYAEMLGIRPGYIKRADIAWFCSHRHSAEGANEAYSYSYLFGYRIDLPVGARTLTLPNNDKIRVLAVSVAHSDSEIHPAHPLYDTLDRSEPGPMIARQ